MVNFFLVEVLHFVRILVDLDLIKEFNYKIIMERKWFPSFVETENENVPEFAHSFLIV